MDKQILEFKVKFIKYNDTDEKEIQKFFVRFSKSHSTRNIDQSVKFESSELCIQNSIYEEPLYEMKITVTIKSNFGKIKQWKHQNCFNDWVSFWCDQHIKYESCWLIPIQNTYFNKRTASHSNVKISGFAFGTIPDMDNFTQHYHYDSKCESKAELLTFFFHMNKYFLLLLDLNHKSNCHIESLQKIVVKYEAISRVIITDLTSTDVYFQLKYPPLVYIEQIKKNRKASESSDSILRGRLWERHLSFGCECNNSLCPIERIGCTLALKITFNGKCKVRSILERIKHRCLSNVEFCYGYLETKIHRSRQLNFPISDTCEEINMDEIQTFGCMYAWELLFSQSLEIKDQINLKSTGDNQKTFKNDYWSFLRANLTQLMSENSDAFCEAIFFISDMINRNEIFSFRLAVNEVFKHFCKNASTAVDLPKGMCLVRRMVITPSRQILYRPTESFDNRVIRDVPNALEYLLRVSIQDDDFSKLTFAIQYHSNKELFMSEVAGNYIEEGIDIGNREYEFLACSNSQLREHSFWCYAEDLHGKTAQDIRVWLGNFDAITNVAKYMARMGQCFSTSDEAVQISVADSDVVKIQDVKSENGKYVFSDGIGKISTALANQVRAAKEADFDFLPDNCSFYKPSAFQIRYKGCKGMLAEDPNCEQNCLLAYRPSMNKFECKTSNKLEILKISAPRSMNLNRPLITILEQLGVPKDVFLNLQKKMILEMIDGLIYEDKAVAILHSHLSLNIPFRALREVGIILTKEPFFRSLLLAIFQCSIEKLKSKARIAIPPEYGRNMLGVLDETKTLEYGHVFVQYSKEIGMFSSETHIYKGTVVVTKNPCMHPGDVRKFEAVDVKDLHHHKDVIVFPALGKRPHPDEMAGSDLDGDEYCVIWMPELIFPGKNEEPMIYPTIREKTHEGEIKVDGMIDFLCNYIQNDNIGPLANAHLVWADYLEEGIFSDICLSLAKKYPFMLDFAKTGYVETMKREEKPKCYPDFMAKGAANNTYQSQKTLGVLYRFVQYLEACVDKIDLETYDNIMPNNFLEYPGWKRYEKSADKHRQDYTFKLMSILKKYSINSEVEALSGFVNKNVHSVMKQHELDNILLIVKCQMRNIINKYRYIFLSELEDESFCESEKKIHKYQKASAWYMVTYRCHSSSVLSFAWVMSDVLIQMRNENGPQKPLIKSSLLDELDGLLLGRYKEIEANDLICPCINILHNMIPEWMICTMSLSMASTKRACKYCCQLIWSTFGENKCCGGSSISHCDCVNACTPTKFVLEFMRFYLSNIFDLGQCERCQGFQDVKFQSAALKTYVTLAITRNYEVLGIDFPVENSLIHRVLDSNEESEPVRIIISETLKRYFENDLELVKELLMKKTNVTDVQIDINPQNENEYYALISSTGNSEQCWELKQLILNPNFTKILKQGIRSERRRNS